MNPSLWRQAQLNNINGLFKVVDGVYQVRGYDVSNMSVIEGTSGSHPGRPADQPEDTRRQGPGAGQPRSSANDRWSPSS